MVNNDILGGLKSALTRGYNLEEAMLSFFNAGYKREEIEEAARTLQSAMANQPSMQLQHPEQTWTNKIQAPIKPGIKTKAPLSPIQAPGISGPIQIQVPMGQKVIVEEMGENPIIEGGEKAANSG